MARVTYVGVNDKARKVKSMYIGVNDKARKIVKAYVGVNSVARIFYTADWWVPYGLNESNCIAAWQFYHSWDPSADISGHNNNLLSVGNGNSHSYDNGWYLGGQLYSNLMNTGVSPVTAVFWYSALQNASDDSYTGGRWFHVEGNNADMAGRIGIINRFVNGAWINDSSMKNRPGFCMTYGNNSLTGWVGNSDLPVSGVVAFDRTYPNIYINGNSIGVTYFSLVAESINNMSIATKVGYATIGAGLDCYIKAAAFFNCRLSSNQHYDIAKMITEIK